MKSNESPQQKRERLRQEELKDNPLGSLNEGLKRSQQGNPTEFVGGMSWKVTGIAILVLIIAVIVFAYFFG
ncbi:hypothetical protein HCA55_09065 [Listeria booriae]|uniref:Phage capsid protein n=1 Tax=Listeria booriae TaxID=1552123 RepID=A0A842B3J1_9LIST|nr:DUF6366 family protein [Listeria booriae]MBC1373282.1 hypothetical protein [Listeria booriae]MBC1796878.1 hypothetical protein [Listeria booriae]MBC1801615.1 hypothetical protein [Listeria booriae]MBC2036775.1 hypothetical protein [Listeria booriae]MBC2324315.1 hypothetical protein [Listeria booriae]